MVFPVPPSFGARHVHGVAWSMLREVGLVQQNVRRGVELRDEGRGEEHDCGQDGAHEQGRRPSLSRHGEQHRQHEHDEGLGGDRRPEEPPRTGPPAVEGDHQGVHARARARASSG